MIDTLKHITVDGVEYPLVFNLNVMETLQEEYGSFFKWADKLELEGGKEPDIKALKFCVCEMINEGIDMENVGKATPRPFISLKQAGRIITTIGWNEIAKTLKGTITDSTKVEDEQKNV